jgi:hypothetical protein
MGGQRDKHIVFGNLLFPFFSLNNSWGILLFGKIASIDTRRQRVFVALANFPLRTRLVAFGRTFKGEDVQISISLTEQSK